jgi:hypothetical protein
VVIWPPLLRSPSAFLTNSQSTPAFNPSKFQLTLGDYFKESPEATKTAEEATDLLGWFLNHQRVRSIFDDAQALRNNGKVLVYLVANLTRWTTHYTAFRRLLDLKTSLQHAVVLSRDKIIAAQVGAKHNAGKRLTKQRSPWPVGRPKVAHVQCPKG